MTIQAILYDNDGTLVDTYDLILSNFQYATEIVLGTALPENQLMKKVGQPLHVQVQDFTNDEALQQQLLKAYRKHNEARHLHDIGTFNGVNDMLEAISCAHISQAVVTSKRSDVAAAGLEHLGMLHYMDFVVGYDHTSNHKPHPEPILFGINKLGYSPAECIYVGDSPFDIKAGNDAGCTTVAVLWGMFGREALFAESPDYIIEEPRELIEIIEKQNSV
ncbi:MAG: HAD-IA family hydrolase [Eggerthellaceae bacterium]|nr:HAD-IA family hydrolase [Eggerthellaceae bacterium]